MRHFEFQGAKVAYVDAGIGEPLVFLHNGGNDHRIWDHQIEHFSTTHRVVAPDHLGYGDSDKPDRIEYALPLYTEMVARMIDELDLAPVTLIGHCIGGAMAINYARLHPDKVSRVVAFNVATERTLLAGPLADVYRELSQSTEKREAFCAEIEARELSFEETLSSLQMQSGEAPPEDTEFVAYLHRLYNLPGQRRSLYNGLSNFASFAAIDIFTKPADFPPLLLIWGEANQILPAAAGRALQERLRPDRVEFVPGCGHLVMREQPDRINRLIAEFLCAPLAPLVAESRPRA